MTGSAGAGASTGRADASRDASDAALGAAGTGGDAGVGGGPLILRLVNAGTADVLLPQNLAATCVFSIALAPAAGGSSRLLSATPPDSWCDCNRCGNAGRPVCETVDPICDGPPIKLAPGNHLDVPWDGRVAITASAPPPGSSCPSPCDHWETATPGDYAFTISTLSGEFTARAALVGPGGVISLALGN